MYMARPRHIHPGRQGDLVSGVCHPVGDSLTHGIPTTSSKAHFSCPAKDRLIDLFNPLAGFSNEDIQRESRSYVSYTAGTEVPTPGSTALAGLALFAIVVARHRQGA